MKKLLIQIIVVILSIFIFQSCKKNKFDTSIPINDLGGDVWTRTAIDNWINDSLTAPFNIEVLYRWDHFQAGEINKTLVPPEESKILPLLRIIKKTWIDSYSTIAGLNFSKKYVPKQIALVGSPSYNSNGSYTLGEAEGGKKILIYAINDLTFTNKKQINGMLHTVHHEFAHILHQTILYTPDYERISVGDYTGDWTNQSSETALSLGFITPYAMSSTDEDFVELIATLLIDGPNAFEDILATTTTEGANKLRKKREIIISYFKTAWNIDFIHFQSIVGEAINSAIANN